MPEHGKRRACFVFSSTFGRAVSFDILCRFFSHQTVVSCFHGIRSQVGADTDRYAPALIHSPRLPRDTPPVGITFACGSGPLIA